MGILSALADAGPAGLPLRELAAALGLRTSTAHSLLSSLLAHGLAGQDPQTRRYRLGGRFLELNRSYLARADLASFAAPVIRELWEATDETVHLSVLQNGRRVDLTILVGPQVLSVIPANSPKLDGGTGHMHRTAAGKALLTGYTDEQLASYLAACDLSKLTPHSLTSRAKIRAEIVDAGRRGFATNREEQAIGVLGVAAPVHDAAGHVVGAVCIGYPAARSSTRYDVQMREAVVVSSRRLSELLGAGHDDA